MSVSHRLGHARTVNCTHSNFKFSINEAIRRGMLEQDGAWYSEIAIIFGRLRRTPHLDTMHYWQDLWKPHNFGC